MRPTDVRATSEERRRAFPGDDLLGDAIVTWTHGVTIGAPPSVVWPWVAQMGAGRAGWYSWDALDNDGRPSAKALLPALQHVAVGDVLPAVPGAKDAFVVARLEPGRDLVLAVPSADDGVRVTWEFLLDPLPGARTRLLARARAGPGAGATSPGPATRPVERVYQLLARMPRGPMLALARAGHRVMQARQLRGIRRRAEAHLPRTVETFMPAFDVRERTEALVDAPAALAFAAERGMDLLSIPLVRAIFRARERLLRSRGGSPRRPQGIVNETIGLGWGVLAERPGREIVMGAYTRPWQPDVVFTALPPDRFAAFAEPGVVKIVWTLEAEPIGPARTRIATETRAVATDEEARRRFRAYWRKARPGIVLIRWLGLAHVRREAERRHRAGSRRGESGAP